MQQTNRTLGEQCHDALLVAAKAQSEALRLEKMAKRKLDELYLREAEGSVAHREATARSSPIYRLAEDEWINAASRANLAKAEAEGLRIRWETWRSEQATTRAEIGMR